MYSMAVQTVMLVATYFGEQEVAWGSDDAKMFGLIISILIIQLVAVLGAFFYIAHFRKVWQYTRFDRYKHYLGLHLHCCIFH